MQRHPKTYGIPAAVDRADLNGFAAYLTGHSSLPGRGYSGPGIWAQISGTGTNASLPNTYEWTHEPFTSSLALPCPAGACRAHRPARASSAGRSSPRSTR